MSTFHRASEIQLALQSGSNKICSRHSFAQALNPEKIRNTREVPVHLPVGATADPCTTNAYYSYSFLRKPMYILCIAVLVPASALKCCYMAKR